MKIFFTVFMPLGCSIGLLIFALVTFVWLWQQDEKVRGSVREFQTYCFSTALFMASFSEIPRQFIPVTIAVPIHFLARYASDWTLYRLVVAYFGLKEPVWRGINYVYMVALLP